MNIPEINIEMKQELRSENAALGKAVERPPAQNGGSQPRADAVQAHTGAQPDKQASDFTKQDLDSMLKEVEEHFEKSDVKLKFNVLEENETVQVEILDSDGKTIRKIPEDEILKLSQSLKNLGKGFLDEVS